MYSKYSDQKLADLARNYHAGSVAGRMGIMARLMGGNDNADLVRATEDQTDKLIKGMRDNRTTYKVDYFGEQQLIPA